MAESGGDRGTAGPGPAAGAEPSAVDVLSQVVDEQRRAEARLLERFQEHGLIDQAVGVLIARLECSPADAFDQLLELERRSGRDLLEVAGDLVGRHLAARTRTPADEATRSSRRLARIERSADGDDLARLLMTDMLAWSGAAEVAIALVQPDGALELVGAAGLPERVAGQWSRIPPSMDCLLNAAVRTEAAVWANADPDTSADATGAAVAAAAEPRPILLGQSVRNGALANPVHAAAPIRVDRGLVGAVEVAWPAGSAFPAEVRGEIVAVLAAIGPAVVRSRRLSESVAVLAEDDPDPPRDSARLREFIDAAWEPMLLVSALPDSLGQAGGLRVAAANPSAVDLLTGGGAGPDPVGRRLAESLPWAVASGALQALRTVLDTGTPYRDSAHSYAEITGTGRHIRYASIAAVRLDESLLLVSLRPEGQVGAGAGPDSHAHEARLRRLSGVGTWEWDVPAEVVHWSAEALAAFGAHTVPGPTPADQPPYQVHRDDVPRHDRLMRTLAKEARSAHDEFRIVRPDGSVRHVRVAGEPVLGAAGTLAATGATKGAATAADPEAPLVTSVHGTVQDVTEHRRAQTALEITQIQLAAQRSRADSERQLADLLQQVIMPVEPARIPAAAGLEIAARYRPASAGVGVGGDWYGIFPLDGSRLLLTVGDIAGHGFAAATAMAQLYHAMYGLALTGAGTGQLLGWLNTVACSLPEFTLASACCAIYDPAERSLQVANAGHPSPVLSRGGAANALPHPPGTMLGVDADSTYTEESVDLEPGDVLLLYTDGLIERRRHSPEENTDRLLAEAAEPEADLNAFVERILARAEADTDDDTCLVAVRFS